VYMYSPPKNEWCGQVTRTNTPHASHPLNHPLTLLARSRPRASPVLACQTRARQVTTPATQHTRPLHLHILTYTSSSGPSCLETPSTHAQAQRHLEGKALKSKCTIANNLLFVTTKQAHTGISRGIKHSNQARPQKYPPRMTPYCRILRAT